MMPTQHGKTLGNIFFILFAVVCLFLIGCGDESVDHYNRRVDHVEQDENDQAIEINPRDAAAYINSGLAYEIVSHL